MNNFRDLNLIDLIEDTVLQAEKGTAREYLEWFSPEVRYEVVTNFADISRLLPGLKTDQPQPLKYPVSC